MSLEISRSGLSIERSTAMEQPVRLWYCALWHVMARQRSNRNCSIQQSLISCFRAIQDGRSARAITNFSWQIRTQRGWVENGNSYWPAIDKNLLKPGKWTTMQYGGRCSPWNRALQSALLYTTVIVFISCVIFYETVIDPKMTLFSHDTC